MQQSTSRPTAPDPKLAERPSTFSDDGLERRRLLKTAVAASAAAGVFAPSVQAATPTMRLSGGVGAVLFLKCPTVLKVPGLGTCGSCKGTPDDPGDGLWFRTEPPSDELNGGAGEPACSLLVTVFDKDGNVIDSTVKNPIPPPDEGMWHAL